MKKVDSIGTLNKNIKKIEFKLNNTKIYNRYCKMLRILLKSGLLAEKILPFFMSSIVWFNAFAYKENKPVRSDLVEKEAIVKVIDTSYGSHIENKSYLESTILQLKNKKASLEFSTKWRKKDNYYERDSITYKISKDLSTIDFLSMSKEEIEQILEIKHIRTIRKEELTEEDKIYNEDAIIYSHYVIPGNDFIVDYETANENLINTLFYIILVISTNIELQLFKEALNAKIFHINKKRLIKNFYIKNHELDENDLKKLKELLKMQQENLYLIKNTHNENTHNRVLKRKKGDYHE